MIRSSVSESHRPSSARMPSMHAHKFRVTVPADHRVVVDLPDEFAAGEVAEITVVSRTEEQASALRDDFTWLENWRASLPDAPTIPLESIDRGEVYR